MRSSSWFPEWCVNKMEEKPPPAKKTRSSVEPFNWRDSCLFCTEYCDIKHNNRKRVCKVETVELRTNILEICEKYPEHPGFCSIAHRVRNCNDLVHLKAVHHKKCMGDFFNAILKNNTTIDDEKKTVNEDQKPAKSPVSQRIRSLNRRFKTHVSGLNTRKQNR